MAIVRGGSRVKKATTHSSSSTDEGRRVKQKQTSAVKMGSSAQSDASSDLELAEGGAEICQFGEEICAVPFELFELPDLKRILSLDTWNFCLTEEERESLCSYLPKLDEPSYRQTLKEVFGGETFHFNSPLTELYDRLKGGLCQPQVVQYREGLKYLQRKQHYHLLHRYHNSMVNYFVEMQNIWQSYPDADIEERLAIWNSWKLHKSKPLPSGPISNKLGFFKRGRLSGRTSRRAKLLKAKELESQELPSDNIAAANADSEGMPPEEPISKVEGNVEGSSKGSHSKDPEKSNELASKSVRKLGSEQVQKKQANQETPTLETGLPLQESTVALPVVVCTSENEVAAVESSVPNKRTVKKGKGTTGGAKHKRVQDISEAEPQKVEQPPSLECPPLEETIEEGTNVQGDLCVDEEQRQLALVTSEDVNKDAEPKKKFRRRANDKDTGTVEEVQAAAVVKTEEDGNVADENTTNDAVMDDKKPVLNEESIDGKPPKKRGRKRAKGEDKGSTPATDDPDCDVSVSEKVASVKKSKKPAPLTVPPIASSFPFSVIHLLSAVRTAMISNTGEQLPEPREIAIKDSPSQEGNRMGPPDACCPEQNGQPVQCDDLLDGKEVGDEKQTGLPAVPFLEIVRRVEANPGDTRILETQEPLQGLVRGVLKVLSSKTAQGVKGWKPFVAYVKEARGWSWVGPLPPLPSSLDDNEVLISAEEWAVPLKTLVKIQELFANWLKHAQETLQQLGQLGLPPPPPMPVSVDDKERFKELRAQKSLITIHPSSEEMRSYFRREEVVRYSLPDRAFSYTRADGQRSVVAPLKRIGGKPNSKARDHFMLKSDRPPHVTILCLVRDAAARLPGSIGTRADVCALIRDSQYIVEDVSDAQLNQVVSGALDRLHYERDPCVRYDADKKLWVYLHTDRDEEDFEDDGTSSTKRWKRQKKESNENSDLALAQDYSYSSRDDQDPCVLGLDFSSPNCFGGPVGLSAVYSTGRPELVYSHQSGSLSSPHVLGNGFPGQVREDSMTPFIELPPSIQPTCVNMLQSHPMGWEVLGNRWDQEPHFHPGDHLTQEDYNAVTATSIVHREDGGIIDRGLQ